MFFNSLAFQLFQLFQLFFELVQKANYSFSYYITIYILINYILYIGRFSAF